MKIIHQNGYSNEELYPWRITVYKNLIESAQALVYGVSKFGLEFDDPKNVVCAHLLTVRTHIAHAIRASFLYKVIMQELANRILEYTVPTELTSSLNPEVVTAIQSVWADSVVPRLLDRGGSDFYLMDSAP